MKIAQILSPKTSATLKPDGSYSFGPALNRENGRQCGGFTNDALGLTGINRMADTPTSKIDAPDYRSIKNGGVPITGGYYVQSIGSNWHVGVIARVHLDNAGQSTGFDAVHYNRMLKEERREEFIAKGSKEWNLIHGFGIGNPVIEFSSKNLDPLEEFSILPTVSAMWTAISLLPETPARKKAQSKLHEANDALKGL